MMNMNQLFAAHVVLSVLFACLSNLAPSLSAETPAAPRKQPANGKLKIFILAGQSNMVGFGTVASAPNAAAPTPGTMDACLKAKPKEFSHLIDKDGKPVVRNDVWVIDLSYADKQRAGWLTTGYGATEGHIGPEYAFGFAVGDYYEDPVLLIKSAWGGRSLFHNFLPPSAAEYPKPVKDGDKGFQYAEILRHVKEITGDLKKHFPSYDGKGYEIVGFGWHQGWNDRINAAAVDAYESNLVHLIKDIRKDLGVANLPFVIANTGIGGWDIPANAPYKARVEKHMAAQLAPADAAKYPQFKGNVAAIETRGFMRKAEESPSKQEFHWNRNFETYYLIGKSMGDAMVELLRK